MENLPLTDNKLESPEKGPVDELQAAAVLLEAHATQLEREGSEADISAGTAERIEKKVGKITSLLKVASMTLALYGSYDASSYATSRYEITTEMGRDGNTEYEHEDQETTRILRFLTGAEALTPEDRILFYRQIVREAYREYLSTKRIFLSEGQDDNSFEQFQDLEQTLPGTKEELRELLIDLYIKKDELLGTIDKAKSKQKAYILFNELEQPYINYNSNLEKAIWELQIKVGSPRIRWADSKANTWSYIHSSVAGPSRANYSPGDNTIYLTPGSFNSESLGMVLTSEDAHALQFNTNPISSRIRIILDMTKTTIDSLKELKSLYAAQHDQYHTPGSIEHEAHSVIEPQLINELRKRATE